MDTLLTIGLIASLLAALTAMHLHLTARPAQTALTRPMDDIDAEFLRIVDREGLRDLWPTL
jgi:hypothetical protein